jgi:hypothetical protein
MAEQLDRDVRIAVYRGFVEDGYPPTAASIGRGLGVATAEVERSLHRLADAHVLVLAPGTPYVWMANPFSALPTPFSVRVGDRRWWGNCIWDALGIVAALHADGIVETSCPDCAEPLEVEVRAGAVARGADAVAHFAVPAAHWWDDIGFN